MRSERFQLDFPDDFPAADFEALHAHLSDTGDERPQTYEWSQWAGACNGIAYRFLALDEHARALAASLEHSISPPMGERYRQERLLFSFFSEGHSCLECFYYGCYFIGAMIDKEVFEPQVDPRSINAAFVVKRYLARFEGEPLGASMRAVNESSATKKWRDTRNVLAHRASPGRDFYLGASEAGWMGDVLSAEGIRKNRSWIANIITGLLSPALGFVQRQLPVDK